MTDNNDKPCGYARGPGISGPGTVQRVIGGNTTNSTSQSASDGQNGEVTRLLNGLPSAGVGKATLHGPGMEPEINYGLEVLTRKTDFPKWLRSVRMAFDGKNIPDSDKIKAIEKAMERDLKNSIARLSDPRNNYDNYDEYTAFLSEYMSPTVPQITEDFFPLAKKELDPGESVYGAWNEIIKVSHESKRERTVRSSLERMVLLQRLPEAIRDEMRDEMRTWNTEDFLKELNEMRKTWLEGQGRGSTAVPQQETQSPLMQNEDSTSSLPDPVLSSPDVSLQVVASQREEE